MATTGQETWRTPGPPAADPARLDRNALEVLSREECLRLIEDAPIGRVGTIVGGVAIVLPVNFTLFEGDVVFRTGTGGKLAAAVDREVLCLEVDSVDVAARTGWSVVVTGMASEMTRPDELAAVADLDLQSWVPGRGRYVRIRADEVAGRRLPR